MWAELQSYRIAELQSVGPLVFRVSELQCYRVHSGRVAKVPSCEVAELHRRRVAQAQSCTGTELHNCGVAELGSSTVAE